MACCLTAPSHNMNQCWLISEVTWPGRNSREIPQPSITEINLQILYLTFHSNLPGANELRSRSHKESSMGMCEWWPRGGGEQWGLCGKVWIHDGLVGHQEWRLLLWCHRLETGGGGLSRGCQHHLWLSGRRGCGGHLRGRLWEIVLTRFGGTLTSGSQWTRVTVWQHLISIDIMELFNVTGIVACPQYFINVLPGGVVTAVGFPDQMD